MILVHAQAASHIGFEAEQGTHTGQVATSTDSLASGGSYIGFTSATMGTAPRHIVAVQGPVAANARYVSVTWDRNDTAATGYEIYRDGTLIGTTTVGTDPHLATTFKDSQATAGTIRSYTVRATFPSGGRSAESAAHRVRVLADSDFGNVYTVDGYSGTDIQKARAAVNAADAAGGGIVQFGARTYTFSEVLDMSNADKVILRGAGLNSTFLTTSIPGATDPCSPSTSLIFMRGPRTTLSASVTAPITRGQNTVQLSSTAGLSAGQVLYFNQANSVGSPEQLAARGVIQDPNTPNDDRYRMDANEIVGMSGNTVTFRFPFVHSFTASVRPQRIEHGNDNRMELMTIQAPNSTHNTFYTLMDIDVSRFTMADVRARWTNRNNLRANGGYDIRLVGVQAYNTNPAGFSGTCKYRFDFGNVAKATIVNSTFGNADGTMDNSHISVSRTSRILVRNNTFYKSDTYAYDEHGKGSMDNIFENNYVNTGHSGLRLGNPSFGFSGPIIIRNNRFQSNLVDVEMAENSYEVRFLNNESRGNTGYIIYASAWAYPRASSDKHGSLRLTIRRNTVTGATGEGFYLGGNAGNYPYPGVKDILINQNHIDVAGRAIVLNGNSTQTQRFIVDKNTGKNSYVHPPFVNGDYWASNADGVSFGTLVDVPWDSNNFTWESSDTGIF